jgi:phage recombination protein Bet
VSSEVALPSTGDSATWTASEKALVEAAGLVNRGQLAPRPVVEAFLLHCRRTGLDPIARQIYCIERGGKWGTQVSIDGARLVAERTHAYRGQTPTQWTADGVTWTDVWLPATPPAAARVGVHREGFKEPLMAVATWDQYAQTNAPMWKKMGPLMLGKCAEMLALRKAFPQDLSGLYSTEEMDQAGAPVQAAVVAEPSGVDWEQLASEATSRGELNELWQRIGREAPHERTPQLESRFREFSQSLIAAAVVPVAAQEAAEPQEPVQGWPVAQIPDGGAQEQEFDRG